MTPTPTFTTLPPGTPSWINGGSPEAQPMHPRRWADNGGRVFRLQPGTATFAEVADVVAAVRRPRTLYLLPPEGLHLFEAHESPPDTESEPIIWACWGAQVPQDWEWSFEPLPAAQAWHRSTRPVCEWLTRLVMCRKPAKPRTEWVNVVSALRNRRKVVAASHLSGWFTASKIICPPDSPSTFITAEDGLYQVVSPADEVEVLV